MNKIAKYTAIAVASVAALYGAYRAGVTSGAEQKKQEVIGQLEARIIGPSPRSGSQALDWVKGQAYNLSCAKYSDDTLKELKAEIEQR